MLHGTVDMPLNCGSMESNAIPGIRYQCEVEHNVDLARRISMCSQSVVVLRQVSGWVLVQFATITASLVHSCDWDHNATCIVSDCDWDFQPEHAILYTTWCSTSAQVSAHDGDATSRTLPLLSFLSSFLIKGMQAQQVRQEQSCMRSTRSSIAGQACPYCSWHTSTWHSASSSSAERPGNWCRSVCWCTAPCRPSLHGQWPLPSKAPSSTGTSLRPWSRLPADRWLCRW